jgi:hypothetical protein
MKTDLFAVLAALAFLLTGYAPAEDAQCVTDTECAAQYGDACRDLPLDHPDYCKEPE